MINTVVRRCFIAIRQLPTRCRCPLCDASEYCGENAWEERIKHLAGHFERAKRTGATEAWPLKSWRGDRELSDWLRQEGLVERAAGGRWRLGDGKPQGHGYYLIDTVMWGRVYFETKGLFCWCSKRICATQWFVQSNTALELREISRIVNA